MSKIKFPIKDADVPAVATYLTLLCVLMNPEVVEWEAYEIWEAWLEGEGRTIDSFQEAARAILRKTFDPEYDRLH